MSQLGLFFLDHFLSSVLSEDFFSGMACKQKGRCVNINTGKQETAFSPACPTSPLFIKRTSHNELGRSQWNRERQLADSSSPSRVLFSMDRDFWSRAETQALWDQVLHHVPAKGHKNETFVVCLQWWHIITFCFLEGGKLGVRCCRNLLTLSIGCFLIGKTIRLHAFPTKAYTNRLRDSHAVRVPKLLLRRCCVSQDKNTSSVLVRQFPFRSHQKTTNQTPLPAISNILVSFPKHEKAICAR